MLHAKMDTPDAAETVVPAHSRKAITLVTRSSRVDPDARVTSPFGLQNAYRITLPDWPGPSIRTSAEA
jgi:hypothetical protein